MGTDYVVFAGVLLFLVLIRTLDSTRMTPIKAATFLMCGYYALLSTVVVLGNIERGVPLFSDVVNVERVIEVTLQYIVAVGTFYIIEQSSDDYVPYVLWSGTGVALVFFVIPPLVG